PASPTRRSSDLVAHPASRRKATAAALRCTAEQSTIASLAPTENQTLSPATLPAPFPHQLRPPGRKQTQAWRTHTTMSCAAVFSPHRVCAIPPAPDDAGAFPPAPVPATATYRRR